jgi:hypothetical protein
MAATHSWKVYTKDNEYIASCKIPFYAAIVCAGIGQAGTTIRYGHGKKGIVFTDFIDADASESYDVVSAICLNNERRNKLMGIIYVR